MSEEERLTVLIAGLQWPPETFLQRLIGGLLESGVAVTVASDRKPAAAWLDRHGFDWIHAPHWEGSAPLRLARLGRACITAGFRAGGVQQPLLEGSVQGLADRLRVMNRFLPFAGKHWDVIYFPWNTGAIEYRPLFEQADAVVLSCRGSQVNVAPHDPDRHELAAGLRVTFAAATAVHCVSHDIMEEAERYGLAPERAIVIPPAVDPALFRPAPAHAKHGSGRLRLVTTGSFIWRKGLEYLLAAARLVLDSGTDLQLEILGDGPERHRVLYTIDDLDLASQVTLMGHRNPADVTRILQQADAFALASLSEGISNAVLEAMSCGLPVVTTDCGGMREAVTDGVEGWVVPPRDPSAMAEALVRLAQDPDLCGRMGAAGRERVLRDFHLNGQVRRFVDLFHGRI